MSERFTSDLLFIIIVLVIAALLGIIIGYLIGMIRKRKAVEILETRISGLEADLTLCGLGKSELESQLADLRVQLKKALAAVSKLIFDKKLAKSAMGVPIKENDLKIIEGIGPKIAEILEQHGIDTWHKLSAADPDEIRSILAAEGGSSYLVHDPATWPLQAKLAFEGNWADLKKYQDNLIGGK